MLPEWQTGIVKQIEQATPNTRRYWIELPAVDTFHFKPGQFVTLDLPIHEKPNKRWRSYSIASTPDNSNIIELVIVHLKGGLGTTYFFDEVKEGTELTVRGPQGVFTLPDVLDNDLYLICTGTGIAPFRSMLYYIRNHNIPHQQLHLIFGTRKHEDVLYEQEMRTLQQDLPGFTYHPVLSREVVDGFAHGYVHSVYESLCHQHPPAHFMLCGWKVMIDEAKHRLHEIGYDRKDIHQELYG